MTGNLGKSAPRPALTPQAGLQPCFTTVSRTFDLGTCKIAVFHTRQGVVYAAQAECPHKKGPLADGLLGGSTLVCPLHSWKFDLSTGASSDSGQCNLKTYPARLSRAGQIVVDV